MKTSLVRTNGIDIHYAEAGAGRSLILLHGGVVSTNPIWAGSPFAYVSHMTALAEHFHVIAPDTRGGGRTVHSGGTITFDQLADDVSALIVALGLEQPLICGFSEGGVTATIVGIRHPSSVRAIVNDAGYDMFDPRAPTFGMMRRLFGGNPESTRADPDVVERYFSSSADMRATFELFRTDQDSAQGAGHWRTYLGRAFDRTTRSPGYTFDDLRAITAPTLVLVGDRDPFCSIEDGATAYRMLLHGALSVLPDVGHRIPRSAIDATIEFLRRHA